MNQKKKATKSKTSKKKVQLRDLPARKTDVTAEQAKAIKGGEDPPPITAYPPK